MRQDSHLLFVVLVLAMISVLPRAAQARGFDLEFGPYVGYYDFDDLTYFESYPLFGARASVRLSPWLLVDGEFDEVYTRRKQTDNAARQVSLAIHARLEPLTGRWSPSFLAGVTFVSLEDGDDPDAFGDGWDLGAGLRYELSPRWRLRADWMLRLQHFDLFEPLELGETLPKSRGSLSAWGRALRVGAHYAF